MTRILVIDNLWADAVAKAITIRRSNAPYGINPDTDWPNTAPTVQTKRLTPSEVRILQLTAEGYSIADAATIIGVGQDTIKHHRANLIRKMDAENMANAVYIGLKQSLIV